MSDKVIRVVGANAHNLKNITVEIPRDKFVVITGLSGSGKSSLAFDTLFAEGQRKYVESLSSYARQFLGRMEKPEVDYIKGVAPAIAIEQKVSSRNPRSTVGTTTEIYDYLKLLFARIGVTISPVSGKEVKKDTVTDVVDYMLSFEEGTKLMITTPLKLKAKRSLTKELEILMSKGYTRVMVGEEVSFIEDILKSNGDGDVIKGITAMNIKNVPTGRTTIRDSIVIYIARRQAILFAGQEPICIEVPIFYGVRGGQSAE